MKKGIVDAAAAKRKIGNDRFCNRLVFCEHITSQGDVYKRQVQQGETVKAPAFKELPLTFECKVLFRQVEALENLAQQEGKWYPADQNGNKDRHIQYIAEITSAYIVK